MIRTTMNCVSDAPHDPYQSLADTILRFTEAVEAMMHDEFAYLFAIGSDALRDRAADEQHLGTRTKNALTDMAMSQLYAMGAQCDVHRGIAAVLPAPKVCFAPYPLARTGVVTAAKAWFILRGDTREERLRRYLNEELGALYGAAWDFTDPDSNADIAALTEDHVVVGATAGLRTVRKKNPKDWEAPYLVHADQPDGGRPRPENQVVRDMFTAAGLDADQAGKPYTLLSAATHGRFKQSGVSESVPTGRSVHGFPTRRMHSSAATTAKVTVLAAVATQTHLLELARYTNLPQERVQERLAGALADWCAMGGVPIPG